VKQLNKEDTMGPKEKGSITGKILVVDDKTPVAAVLSGF
jgi:hypothetical protein